MIKAGKNRRKSVSTGLVFLLFSGLFFPGDAASLTIKQEEDLGKEFMGVVYANYKLINDSLLLSYVNEMGKRIVDVMPEPPFTYRFYLVEESVYNAFAGPAGHIFINSGLFEAMDEEEELAGILSHEIAHVQCRHIAEKIERAKKIGIAALAGMVAGIFLGAGGAAAVGNAITLGSTAAAQSAVLAFSRENEIQADQIGLQYLYDAGYEGRGLLNMLRKIRSKQWFGTDQIPNYLSTHPASEDRMAYIDAYIHSHSPREPLRKDSRAFQIAHTRLVALYGDLEAALRRFKAAVDKNTGDSLAHFGYALVLSRESRYDESLFHIRAALAQNAFDKNLLTELGKIYFLKGSYEAALQTLSGVVDPFYQNPDAAFYLARSQAALGKNDAAENTLNALAQRHPEYPQIDYFLGEMNQKQGRLDLVHYYLGMHYYKTGDIKKARFHLLRAKAEVTDAQKQEAIESVLKSLGKEQQ